MSLVQKSEHMKVCFRCELEKPAASEFYSHPTSKDGFGSFCKECSRLKNKEYREANRERLSQHNKNRWADPQYRAKDKERKEKRFRDEEYRKRYLLRQQIRNHNITEQQYFDLLEVQQGVCAICEDHPNRFYVDHDHKCCPTKNSCGKCVRGLLCMTCNTSLGGFRDDVVLMEKGIHYLRTNRANI